MNKKHIRIIIIALSCLALLGSVYMGIGKKITIEEFEANLQKGW